ncbi:MAG: hypothetical protein HKN03_05655 [Acidimicrobiales bacterium]|nr:hypothetical protein [Acidimicrobiales bacterium]
MPDQRTTRNGEHSPFPSLQGYGGIEPARNSTRLAAVHEATGELVEIARIDLGLDPLGVLRTICRTRVESSQGASGLVEIRELGLVDQRNAYVVTAGGMRNLEELTANGNHAPAEAVVRQFGPVAQALAFIHRQDLAFDGIGLNDLTVTKRRHIQINLCHALEQHPTGESLRSAQKKDVHSLIDVMRAITASPDRNRLVGDEVSQGHGFHSAEALARALVNGRPSAVNEGSDGLTPEALPTPLTEPKYRSRSLALPVAVATAALALLVIVLIVALAN